MKSLLVLAAACLGLSMTAAAVNVTVSQPGNNQQVGSPFTVIANATTPNHITGWHIYLDGLNVYTGGAVNSINASITAPPGTHQLVTRAWDTSGAYGSVVEQITVTNGGGGGGGGGGLPTPPGNATVFNHIDDRDNWSYCHNAACSGGSGQGTYWMAQNQGSPSKDGASTEFYNSGVWGNSLWTQKLGANNNVHNFLWDFWFYVDSQADQYGQALEFDTFQFVSGYNYMIGSQCDYGQHKWDTWNEAVGHWIPTSLACPNFSVNAWHHIQWYVTTNTSNHTYTYVTLVVDGTPHSINYTGHALHNGWGNNLGVQWQLDDNARGGAYTEWIDSSTLTIW
jgi:hypothetical protein